MSTNPNVVAQTNYFRVIKQTRPHKQWFEVSFDVAAWQSKMSREAYTSQAVAESLCELNAIIDYFASVASEVQNPGTALSNWRWRFWDQDSAASAVTFARIKWE